MQSNRTSSFYIVATLFFALAFGNGMAWAQEAIAPKPLVDITAPDAIKQLRPNYGDPVYKIDGKGITVSLPAARGNYPGIQIIPPAKGEFWDVSPYGHIEAKITNTGDKLIKITMRVDGIVSGQSAFDAEVIGVKPGESKILKVILGYSWGFKSGPALEPGKINQIIVFATKATEDQSFRIDDLQAAGPTGEKPPFNADYVVTVPENGVILGKGVKFDPAKQVTGLAVDAGPDGSLKVNFTGGKEQTLNIKPVMGVWNLNQANQIRVKFKNVGNTPATPSVVVGANTVPAKAPIAPGAESEIVVSFIPAVPTVCATEWNAKPPVVPGTSTTFESAKAREIGIVSDSTAGAKSLLITSIVADAVIADIPNWLGKKPPVDGDWTQTFDEKFNGPTLDYQKWNIYGHNFWDKRTHFSKDNLILKDGKAILHYEKKTGFHNDDPTNKETGQTDYACGFLNTYGKWTQRYGYFESRMKLPKAPSLWPAFWLMPDRGAYKSYKGRYRPGTSLQPDVDPGNGGMEFDILEFLTIYGPYRYNIAMHWDGYGKTHKSTGSDKNYFQADKDGYVTAGLLWTPGSAIYYCNGKEILRWENPRVSDEQEYIMYDMVSGGWDKEPLDDAKLPDDFYIDYCRVWQRKDLATPEDGPHPNKGDPSELKN